MDKIKIIRIVHLEDDENDAELVERELKQADPACEIRRVENHADYLAAVNGGAVDVILSDSKLVDLDGLQALAIARRRLPDVPFLFVSGSFDGKRNAEALKMSGAADCILKSELSRLAPSVERVLPRRGQAAAAPREEGRHTRGMERLVTAIQELSLARSLENVMAIVRRAARELTGADGATFIMRDGEQCFYADEDAIAPLWKGKRFPMDACISGWAMLNRSQAAIEDIYADPRIPCDAYRPTFVKSLAMVPIRTLDPLGAIGNYWAERHRPTPEEMRLLQALADTTAVALENVRVYSELEQRIRDRTAELQATNRELETFSYAVSHDLRAPLRHIEAFSRMLVEECADILKESGQEHVRRIRVAVRRMNQLIEDILGLSRTVRIAVHRSTVDISRMAEEIVSELRAAAPDREIDLVIAPELSADGDPSLLRVVYENLLSNAWKFTGKRRRGRIEVGSIDAPDGKRRYYVRDNGAGFDMAHAGSLFGVFERLHSEKDFPGTGIGLATVQRVIQKHGGRIWAEAAVNQGACIYFTLA